MVRVAAIVERLSLVRGIYPIQFLSQGSDLIGCCKNSRDLIGQHNRVVDLIGRHSRVAKYNFFSETHYKLREMDLKKHRRFGHAPQMENTQKEIVGQLLQYDWSKQNAGILPSFDWFFANS